MTIRISVNGGDQLAAALRALGDEVADDVRKAVYGTAFELRGDIVKRIQRGPASGRVYKRGGVLHQASAPGEAPASDTGRLANSVYLDDEAFLGGRAVVTVGSVLAYAKHLEYGTRKMAPRPAWTPAAEQARRRFRDRLEAVIRGATQ